MGMAKVIPSRLLKQSDLPHHQVVVLALKLLQIFAPG